MDTAPLPHLGTPDPNAPAQPWSADSAPLSVAFPFVTKDFRRQTLAHYKRLWWLYAILSILFAGGMYLMYWASGRLARNFLFPLVFMMLELPVGTSLMVLLTTWLGAKSLASSIKDRRCILILSATGVRKTAEPRKRGDQDAEVSWKAVGKVMESGGGWAIMRRRGVLPLDIPGSAFESPESAARFAQAVRTLAQTNGNMSAVPQETRTEFAAQPLPAPSV